MYVCHSLSVFDLYISVTVFWSGLTNVLISHVCIVDVFHCYLLLNIYLVSNLSFLQSTLHLALTEVLRSSHLIIIITTT